MVTKCANPQCTESFLYLTLGRLFFVPQAIGSSPKDASGRPENWRHYWLCEKCSQQLTIKPGDGEEIKILPRGVRSNDAGSPPGGGRGLAAD